MAEQFGRRPGSAGPRLGPGGSHPRSPHEALTPLGPDRTLVDVDLLVEPGQLGADIDDCAGFWDLVNRQDWAVCESVQRGLSSAFHRQGWYAPMEDAALDIRRWLLPRLERPGLPR